MEKPANTQGTSEMRRKLLDGPLSGQAKDLLSNSNDELSSTGSGSVLRFRLPIDERMNWSVEWGTLVLETTRAYATELANVVKEALSEE